MEDKKPSVLDILRFIIAILTFVGALFVGIYLFLGIYNLFTGNNEDGFSGLIFIVLFPYMLGSFAYSIIGMKWIKKYKQTKNIPLIKRSVGIGESVVKMVLSILFLSYLSIPFVVYWGLDLIEAIMRNNMIKRINSNVQPNPVIQSPIVNTPQVNNNPQTNTGINYCKHCGAEINYNYDRFCEHCGKEIEHS